MLLQRLAYDPAKDPVKVVGREVRHMSELLQRQFVVQIPLDEDQDLQDTLPVQLFCGLFHFFTCLSILIVMCVIVRLVLRVCLTGFANYAGPK